MSRLVLVLLILCVACSSAPVEVEGLSCDGGRYERVELEVDPDGTEFARQALADFVFGVEFQTRPEWVALHRSETDSTDAIHAYADDTERVQLIVELEELPGGWFVSSYRYCE